jgi:hypothetical protein
MLRGKRTEKPNRPVPVAPAIARTWTGAELGTCLLRGTHRITFHAFSVVL